jgi:hypothetical protein
MKLFLLSRVQKQGSKDYMAKLPPHIGQNGQTLRLLGRRKTPKSHHSCNVRIHFSFLFCRLLFLKTEINQNYHAILAHWKDNMLGKTTLTPSNLQYSFQFFSLVMYSLPIYHRGCNVSLPSQK